MTEKSFVLFIRILLVLKTLDLSVSGNHIIFPWFKERENGVSGWVGPSVHTEKVGRRHLRGAGKRMQWFSYRSLSVQFESKCNLEDT